MRLVSVKGGCASQPSAGQRASATGEREQPAQPYSFALMLCKLFCYLRIYGMEGLGRWFARRLSVLHAWRVRAVRRKARRFYRESRRRGRVFGKRHSRHGGLAGDGEDHRRVPSPDSALGKHIASLVASLLAQRELQL